MNLVQPEKQTIETLTPRSPWRWAGLGAAVVLALVVRLRVFDFESWDYTVFLGPWYAYLLEHGRFAAFKDEFYDYTPPYLYLISLSTFLGLKPIYAIKLVSMVFEALLAFMAFRVVRLAQPAGTSPHWAAVAVWFFPTVILNGSLWGQCDAIHTSLLVLSLYGVLRNRPFLACIAYGLALSFKLQSIFLFPVFLILICLRQIRFTHLTLLPFVYLAAVLPCLVAGRPLKSLLTIYFKQAGLYETLTRNAPNIYQWIPGEAFASLATAGIICAAAVTGLLMAAFVFARQATPRFSTAELFHIALLFAVLEPFLLPRMHDRYFYSADILAIIYAFLRPDRWFLPILIGAASLYSYLPFLFGFQEAKVSYAAVVMAAALGLLLWDSVAMFHKTKTLPTADAAPSEGA